jgi:transcriptional regulator with XRE-family HTH domain
MATRRVEIGPTGETVRANIAQVRKEQGLTLRDVADRLKQAGWPMAHNTVSEIERGARRVDVDDLVALAEALGVSTAALLGDSPTSAADLVAVVSDLADLVGRVDELKVAVGLPAAGVVKDAAGNVISDEDGNPPVNEAQKG